MPTLLIAAARTEAARRSAGGRLADARMQHIEALLTDIRMEMVSMRGDLRALPSKASLWGMIGATIATASALIAVFAGVLAYLQAFHLPH